LILKLLLLHLKYKFEANHNKDYSVVKTFKAGGNSRLFLCPQVA